MIKKVIISEYFEIKSTIQSDKINFKVSNKINPKAFPFLGRSSINNGIVDYVEPLKNLKNKSEVLTIALDGSTGATFYQHHEYCSGQNIWQLIPKKKYFKYFNPIIAIYLKTTISKAVESYSYNLSLTKTRLSKVKILLPVLSNKKVDLKYIEKEMNKLRNIKIIKNISPKRILK